MLRRGVVLAGLALPLAGCSRGARVEVSGVPFAPTFTIRKAGLFKGDVVFPGDLKVYDWTDRPPEIVWAVTADRARPSEPVVYGRTPPGARELTPPRPLREGRIYYVGVSGGGYYGGAYFKIVGDRLVTVEGTGDAP